MGTAENKVKYDVINDMTDRIRVVIADDHAIVREGIKNLVELSSEFEVVGLADNGKDALNICKKENPDVLLLDISMPTMSGIETMRRLLKLKVKTRVIALTIHDEKAYLVETLSLGVKGYVLKDADSDVLLDAIREVSAGNDYVYPSMRKYLDKKTKKMIVSGKTDVFDLLTSRELEIIKFLAMGMSNKDISDTLYISEKTVKNHVSSVFRKLGINDRTSAAMYAVKKGLIEV